MSNSSSSNGSVSRSGVTARLKLLVCERAAALAQHHVASRTRIATALPRPLSNIAAGAINRDQFGKFVCGERGTHGHDFPLTDIAGTSEHELGYASAAILLGLFERLLDKGVISRGDALAVVDGAIETLSATPNQSMIGAGRYLKTAIRPEIAKHASN